ncbi:type II toxin-antitoxin system VapC family toxin [Synechococcus sp. Tobar12-5m-g]|uniref:type II toxin-antitoxin system VapC family toxin n=1 Tax=Synechococcus sp. Cruz CV-v-12 TaxID=2823728 RepID=UPI0020CD2BE8|nr:type II toxin-antitoxin system VapC family toxin [Synechococcus sp. Cruz CV-v-12]MCP9772454.1 type II toxin-antitoxin system VapC family toxin [Synechococcus sp. Tobar12-5m-g]MCP9874282.1 type II toxin-antitoxin system VapC family toxin [Synechococcus sp. Cruz CV-v-12]
MIVADASAVVAALLNDGPARRSLSSLPIHAPHLVDVEVVSVLRRLSLGGQLDPPQAERMIIVLATLGIRLHGSADLLGRVWQLRGNLTAYDATYVALAETLSCHLLTADRRLANAFGPRCPIQLVPG